VQLRGRSIGRGSTKTAPPYREKSDGIENRNRITRKSDVDRHKFPR
jgi:hypothetical protein